MKQLVPGPQLVDELVAVPKIVRADRIQQQMGVQTRNIPALRVVGELEEAAFSQSSVLFRVRESVEGQVAVAQRSKHGPWSDTTDEHDGNCCHFLLQESGWVLRSGGKTIQNQSDTCAQVMR